MAGLPLSGDLESVSRPSYDQVAARTHAIGPPPSAPMHEWAGIKGALGDEAISSGQRLEWSMKCTEAVLFVQPKPKPIRLV